ncbi:hypothetical protein AAEX28_16015 [Lentisphaerota bacterium WC36G]|nr:hypothetical protein LJT99_02775 [Lentisphaerae bacterium WC36]
MLEEKNLNAYDLKLLFFKKVISQMSNEELREAYKLNQNNQEQLQNLVTKKIIEELLILYINKNP